MTLKEDSDIEVDIEEMKIYASLFQMPPTRIY